MEPNNEPGASSSDNQPKQKSISAAKLERKRQAINMDLIYVSDDRFRHVSEEEIDKIAESIRQNDLLQPIGLRQRGEYEFDLTMENRVSSPSGACMGKATSRTTS